MPPWTHRLPEYAGSTTTFRPSGHAITHCICNACYALHWLHSSLSMRDRTLAVLRRGYPKISYTFDGIERLEVAGEEA